MASRNGPTAAGTDGSDFCHREKVANHYKSSVTNKGRVKVCMVLHAVFLVFMTIRLSTFIFVLGGMRPPHFLQQLKLPRPSTWEFVWLITYLPVIFGWVAVRKNRIFLLQQFLIGVFVFGIFPLVFAMYYNLDDLLEYWETKSAMVYYLNKPVVVLQYIFIVIVLQLHSFEVYFSYQLLTAWKPVAILKKHK